MLIYDYKGNSATIVGNQKLVPIVPNISYMAHNFFIVYTLFLSLLELIFNSSYVTKNLYSTSVYILYNKKQYKYVLSFMKKYKKYFDITFYRLYAMLCYYKLNRKDKFLKYAELLLQSKLDIVSYRHHIMDVYASEEFRKILIKYYTQKEISAFIEVCEHEDKLYNNIWQNNKSLREYYAQKLNR